MLLYFEIKLISLVLYWRTYFCEKFEGFVVGGDHAAIEAFSYSAYISIGYKEDDVDFGWGCGSSILNQRVLLSAAHCVFDCKHLDPTVIATVGHSNLELGTSYQVNVFYIHEDFDEVYFSNDISLIGLQKSLELSNKVGRVAIYRRTLSIKSAYVAGWGLINEELNTRSNLLKKVSQHFIDKKICEAILTKLSKGTLCAGGLYTNNYPSLGDSGCALIMKKIIQVGIVSNKILQITRDVTVYTDIAYHYDWIKKNSMNIFCE